MKPPTQTSDNAGAFGRLTASHFGWKTAALLLAMTGIACQPPVSNRERLKAEILQEVMLEVREQLAAYGVSGEGVDATRAQFKKEIEDDILKKLQMLAPESRLASGEGSLSPTTKPAGPTGAAEGRILHKGKGLPNCHVKLVRLVEAATLVGLLKVFKEGTEFEAITDREGKYRFEALPVGSYKLKWQLPGEAGWIRRLRDTPDATIEAGKTRAIKPIETARGVVSR